jgi:hypothetical protein
MNAVSISINIASWLVLLYIVKIVYKEQEMKPAIWKMILAFIIGLFSFSINLPFNGEPVRLAILPLGVWLLYWILSKRSEGLSWQKYRKFAWIGFFANYIFLIGTLSSLGLDGEIYPKRAITTYLGDLAHASILKTNPSGEQVKLDKKALIPDNLNFQIESIYSEKWYQETFMENSTERKEERFPYMLTGVKPKWGSGIQSEIFIEKDGKGLLINTGMEQIYFRSEETIFEEES